MSSSRANNLPQFFEVKARIEFLEAALTESDSTVPFIAKALDKVAIAMNVRFSCFITRFASCSPSFVFPRSIGVGSASFLLFFPTLPPSTSFVLECALLRPSDPASLALPLAPRFMIRFSRSTRRVSPPSNVLNVPLDREVYVTLLFTYFQILKTYFLDF